MNQPVFLWSPSRKFFPDAIVAPVGRMIYVAAQAAFDETMSLVGRGDFRIQARQCLRNIERVLALAAGDSVTITSSVAYIVDIDDQAVAAYVSVMKEAIRSGSLAPHATSLVGVDGLPHGDMLIEISAVAVIPG